MHFICQWLKVFAISNQCNLELRASKYLASKGLAYDNWTFSITVGMKGDIFALYALCMLFNRHALVHLHNRLVWSTLDQFSEDHYADRTKCDLHLCYVSHSLFVELTERDKPLELASDSTKTVQSVIVGKLTSTENRSLMMVLTAGLGTGIAKEEHPKRPKCIKPVMKSIKEEASGQSTTHDPAQEGKGLPTAYIKIVLKRLNIGPNDRVQVSQQLLDSIPISKYKVDTPIDTSDTHNIAEDTKENSSSDETVAYWTPNEKYKPTLRTDSKLQTSASSVEKVTNPTKIKSRVGKWDRTF